MIKMFFSVVFLAALISFLVTLVFMPKLIQYFRAKHEGQMIREEGPSWHEKKSGTPTMGGLLFILGIIVSDLLVSTFFHRFEPQLFVLLFILLLYGLLGMWDDSIKIFRRQNEGLKAWQKFSGQIFGAIVFAWVFHMYFPLSLGIPGYGQLPMGGLYVVFIIIWLTGFSNAVNLTDGLDGLVTGLSIISFTTYGIIAYAQGQTDVLIFCASVVGAMLAFFIFNHKPAKIFMGDMGSLALGGSLAAVSILLHHEFSLLWIGIIFVLETLSVIIQVTSFKLTGKRVFKMTPIHHHFEMMGWNEWRIDLVFWGISLITSISGLLLIL